MSEKLQVVATQLLHPETEGGPSSLLIVLGTPPREAQVAFIASSRAQVITIVQGIGADLEEGQMQKILTVASHIDSFPEESDEPGLILDEIEDAQAAFDQIAPEKSEGEEEDVEALTDMN